MRTSLSFGMNSTIDLIGLVLLFVVYRCSGDMSMEMDNIKKMTNMTIFDQVIFDDTGMDSDQDVLFYLYTRQNPEVYQMLLVDDDEVLSTSDYNSTRSTTFFTHGWLQNSTGSSSLAVRDAFLDNGDLNVILVDWGTIAQDIFYPYPASKVRAVGKHVAKMINFLMSRGSDPESFTLVGHSLGAHATGFAGKYSDSKLAHIVGLDPAGPGFEVSGPEDRIDRSDAQFVDIVHTSGLLLGMYRAIGHRDFYPNGGTSQPGCGIRVTCSHSRSHNYYSEALVRRDAWYAVFCETYEKFRSGQCSDNPVVSFPGHTRSASLNSSEEEDESAPLGSYMLKTHSSREFGMGLEGVQVSRSADSCSGEGCRGGRTDQGWVESFFGWFW